MIRERPGEPNDREYVISTLDNSRYADLDKYRDNYVKIFGNKQPYWEKLDTTIKNIDK